MHNNNNNKKTQNMDIWRKFYFFKIIRKISKTEKINAKDDLKVKIRIRITLNYKKWNT